MSTLTIEYAFTDNAGKLHAGTIRNVPDGRMTHARLSHLAALWADATPAEWRKLECYNSAAEAVRSRMEASRAARAGVGARA